MKNNILLYFPDYQDIHFEKDVGQIPLHISEISGGEFHLITRKKGPISTKNKLTIHLFETGPLFFS